MEWVERVARSVDEAKDLVLDALCVAEDDAEFEVLEEPRPGLFGRMRGEARVRARVRPVQPRPKVDRRERRRSGRGRAESGRSSGRKPGEAGSSKPAPAAEDDKGSGDEAPRDADAGRGSPSGGGGGGRGRRRGGRNRGDSDRGGAPRAEERNGPTTSGRQNKEKTTVTIDATQQAEIVQEFLGGLAGSFGIVASTASETIDEEMVEVRLNSEDEDLGYLIGPKGATISAITELAKAVVNHRADGERSGRFRVDVGDYRAKRREALARFATKLAEDVRESGEPKLLEPMGAADRKVVHDTVNDIDGVRTESVGAEPRRQVKIVPAD